MANHHTLLAASSYRPLCLAASSHRSRRPLPCPSLNPQPCPPPISDQTSGSRILSPPVFSCQVPPPPPPDALTDRILDVPLSVGYQRLRKALLWNDSKLQAALFVLLVS